MGAITTRLSICNDLREKELNKLSIAATGYLAGVVYRWAGRAHLVAAPRAVRPADYRKSRPGALPRLADNTRKDPSFSRRSPLGGADANAKHWQQSLPTLQIAAPSPTPFESDHWRPLIEQDRRFA